MTGYHYTSKSNWLKIQKEGLKKYRIDKAELKKLFPKGIEGIWVWAESPVNNSHIGCLMYQVGTKEETKIVKLKIKFDNENILRKDGRKAILFHQGILGSWYYHSKDKAYILIKDVPLKNIKLIKEYDINKLLL